VGLTSGYVARVDDLLLAAADKVARYVWRSIAGIGNLMGVFTAGASAGTSVVEVNCGSCVETSPDKSGAMACGDVAMGDSAGITAKTASRDRAEKTCTYLAVASQRKADEAISKNAFFNVIGEVANWLSASDEHLLGLEIAKIRAAAWRK
jgi:hypothetical protein